jgi:Ca-activated chloride channel family protein
MKAMIGPAAGRWAVLCLLALTSQAVAGEDDDDEASVRYSVRTEIDFEGLDVQGDLVAPQGAMMSGTPGGAQDIAYLRDQVATGVLPRPETFTPEGLFSEHDLTLTSDTPCERLMCVHGKAVSTELVVQPDVEWLAQIGFSSSQRGLDAIERHLDAGDRLSIVTYGSDVSIDLEFAGGDDRTVHGAIDRIRSGGSTAMEAGLATGFELARRHRQFDGTTRVMLFTDEQPNVGRTHAESFMGMAREASLDGIGLTTLGVGRQFGAELATKIGAVRGGNLFFFRDIDDLVSRLEEDFDTMVTELAYDLELVVHPRRGMKIAGVYGIPGSAVEWTDDGGLRLTVETVFASKRSGAIYVGFSRDGRTGSPASVAEVDLSYEARDGEFHPMTADIPRVTPSRKDVGLVRGVALVDEATALRQASALHHAGDDEEAWRVIDRLLRSLRSTNDPELRGEIELVAGFAAVLAERTGRSADGTLDLVSGLPIR